MTHQPAISFSISFQHPFNRAGGRTSNVRSNNSMSPEILPFCIIFLLIHLSILRGAVLVDQQVGLNGQSALWLNLRENETGGQSFTPDLPSIQFITINTLSNGLNSGPVEATLRLGLYLGNDRSTSPIMTSPNIVLRSRFVETGYSDPYTFGYYQIDPLTWVFDNPALLDVGVQYSFFIDHIAGDELGWIASLEPYSGGHAIVSVPYFDPIDGFIYGPIDKSYNFGFSTGILVPEPSTSFLIVLSSIVALTRRRASNKA